MKKVNLKATWASHSFTERALAYSNIRITSGISLVLLLAFLQKINPTNSLVLIMIVASLDFVVLIWHRIETLEGKEKRISMISLMSTSFFVTIGLHLSGGAATLGYSIYFAVLISTALIFRRKKETYVISVFIIFLYSLLVIAELTQILPTDQSVFYKLYISPRQPRLFANIGVGILLLFLFSYGSGEMAELLGNWSISLTKEVEKKTAEHVVLSEKIQKTYIDIVTTLANAIDFRDHYTSEHSNRIAFLAQETARILACSDEFIDRLRFAAILHDVGKIGVPDYILNKPGQLTNKERIIMQKHPDIGGKLIANIEELEDVALIVRAHHEKFDGTGYPDGLRGEEIPFAARIIAVADVYTAITDDRSYKKARSSSDAIQLIIRQSGKHFDPQVVDAFLSALQNKFFLKEKTNDEYPQKLSRFTER